MEYEWNVKNLLDWTTKYFEKVSISPRSDAEILLSFVLKKPRLWLYTNFNALPTAKELEKYREFVRKRAKGVPVHHITKSKQFMALDFKINENVLVPRPETEELVEKLLNDARENSYRTFVDVGCGSGVIAVSLAKYLKSCEVWAIDINPAAVELTSENAKKHGVSQRVHVGKYGFEPLNPDVVVSNPPYLTVKEWDMFPELHKEPYEALVGGVDGNDMYEFILKRYLPKRFYFEIAHPFRPTLKEILKCEGFSEYEVFKDMAKRDRILVVKGKNFSRAQMKSGLKRAES